MGASRLLLVFLALVALLQVKGCKKGDAACFCETSIGGTYKVREKPVPVIPACRVNYTHQGINRYVHIYLPSGYDGVTAFPLWVELHGVFWASMGGVTKQVDGPVNGTDVIPHWDKGIEQFGDQVIMVYPQAMGEAGTGADWEGDGEKFRQFWSIPFWRCSVKICQAADLDDRGFIEHVIEDLPSRLTVAQGKYYLAGESAGGMMVEALLCQSSTIANRINAAVNILGGVGAEYALGANCSGSPPMRYLHLHGMEDPSITYNKRIDVDGVEFLSAVESAKQRAQHNGCTAADAGPTRLQASGKLQCTDYCERAAGKPAAVLCGIVGAAHDLDHPEPGFAFAQAWKFLQQTDQSRQGQVAGAVLLRETAVPAAVTTGQNRSQQPAAAAAMPPAAATTPTTANGNSSRLPPGSLPAAQVPTVLSTKPVEPNHSTVIGRKSLL